MKTEEAYQQYIVTANNQADYMNTLLWLLFIIFVIAPLLTLVAWTIYKVGARQKCPECGSRRNSPALETIKKDDKTITKQIVICSQCNHEF